jgi:hypothetical protein
LNTITVSKARLIKTLTQNRAKHGEEYIASLTGWHQKVLTALNETAVHFDQTQETKDLNIGYRYPKPEDHTAEYDRALEMLAWETDDSIRLSVMDFRRLVQDDWDWSETHKAFSSQYNATT